MHRDESEKLTWQEIIIITPLAQEIIWLSLQLALIHALAAQTFLASRPGLALPCYLSLSLSLSLSLTATPLHNH